MARAPPKAGAQPARMHSMAAVSVSSMGAGWVSSHRSNLASCGCIGFSVAMMVAVLSWPTKATWWEAPPVDGSPGGGLRTTRMRRTCVNRSASAAIR